MVYYRDGMMSLNNLTTCIYLLLILCCGVSTTLAQELVITGRVLDADTKEGLPFSNVYFPGSTAGTSTDLDGYFDWSTPLVGDSIAVSALGYDIVVKKLPSAVRDTIRLNFHLESEGLELEEVVVLAGENPANILMRKVIKDKPINDIQQLLPSFHYEEYSKMELDLENISKEIQESRWMRPFDFVFDNIDSTSDEKPFLPFYIHESLSEVYHSEDMGKPSRVIKAEQTSGIDNNTVVDYIKGIHKDFNLYSNWIEVLGKNFASPFSDIGLFYYEYYIIDSAYIDNQWCRKLKFKPKRKAENTFFGDFWIADESNAIVRTNMRMSPDVNINLVNRIIVFLEYAFHEEKKVWAPKTRKMVVDFNIEESGMGVIGRQTRTFKDYNFSPTNVIDGGAIMRLSETENKDEAFWQKARHVPLTENEAVIYSMVDSIQNVPIYKTYVQVVETIFTGYVGTGAVQLGTPYSLYSYNDEEGHRVRLGFRTTSKMSKVFRFKGSVAYGFGDQKWKYSLLSEVILQRNPRITIGAQHLSDISLNSENSEAFLESNLFSGTFRRDILQKLIRVTETRLFYKHEWGRGLTHKFTLLHRKLDPINRSRNSGLGFGYAYLDDPNDVTVADSVINTTEMIWKLRWAEGEQFLEDGFVRTSMGTDRPIVELQYTLGIKNAALGDYQYHKVELNYKHWIDVQPIGWMDYRFRVGAFFGQAPFLLMSVHPGNESYFMTPGRFNLMNRYEFASDRYVSWMVQHHFDGYLLNKIPWVRKLQWRTVASFKGVYGQMSDANLRANQLNAFDGPDENYSGFRVADSRPYMEAGIGIENIFKIIRIDALWRLSYLDNPEVQRFSIAFGLDFHF